MEARSPSPPPPPSQTISFTNSKLLFQVIEQITQDSIDCLIVENVSTTDFEEINRERLSRRFRLRRYEADKKILIITIPTALHEALHVEIYETLRDQLLSGTWKTIASTTFRPKGHLGGDGGEADSSGTPKEALKHKDTWPRLVIEAGVSESLGALQDDMRWWFRASEHQVKIVILVKFESRSEEIIIERWEEEFPTRPSATTTRRSAASAALQPILRQHITITRIHNAASDSYDVARGALILPFRLLFLRQPGPQEGDLVMSVPALEEFARYVWTTRI